MLTRNCFCDLSFTYLPSPLCYRELSRGPQTHRGLDPVSGTGWTRRGPGGDRSQEGGHYRVELGEFTKTHYSRYYIPILMCTFLNPQNSMQSQMHGCIFLGEKISNSHRVVCPPKSKKPLLQVHLPVHRLVNCAREPAPHYSLRTPHLFPSFCLDTCSFFHFSACFLL